MRQHQIPHPSQPIEYALSLDPKIFLFFLCAYAPGGRVWDSGAGANRMETNFLGQKFFKALKKNAL
jgi:hypothetical protein